MIMKNIGLTKLQTYHLEDEANIRTYHRWLKYQEKHREERLPLEYEPLFSVVIPVYNTVTEQLEEAINSVLNQSYNNYELILVDDHSSWDNVVPVLKSFETNEHVHIIYRETNGHISVATNDGLNAAKGDFIAFMDCDDTIEQDALYEFAKKLNENPKLDFIYSDEDKITADGKIRHMPFFKPDWSPDLFMTMNYTNHLSVYRASVVKKTGGLRSEYNGSQDYDFVLRFMEHSDNKRVGHISRILYHWRERKESVAFEADSKNYAAEAAKRAKEDCLTRRSISGTVEYDKDIAQYRVVYNVINNPLVSIVIPSKDNPKILRQCIDSIIQTTSYSNYEIIVVDNGSSKIKKACIERYLKKCGASYIYEKKEFNFSYMCNRGADAANGEYLLFLNDDIKVIQPDWLERMLSMAQQPHIGAVGTKLLFPDSSLIQHAGVSNIKEGPSHSFLRCDDTQTHYFGFSKADYDCIAVTGACLIVSREIFRTVGGFDESFPVAYNDVDLCFSIYEAGFYNVQCNDVISYHYESLSRGNDMIDENKMLRLSSERIRLYKKHPKLLGYDPFMNCHLHTYSSILDLEQVYDNVKRYCIPDSEDDVSGNIDSITAIGYLRIAGWAAVMNADNSSCVRNVLLKDIYGVCYRAETMIVQREDVYKSFGNRDDLLLSGFEALIDPQKIRMDIIPYSIGVEITDDHNKPHIKWFVLNHKTNYSNKLRQYNDCERVDAIYPNLAGLDVKYSIDEVIRLEKGLKIRGFAFLDTNNDYLYTKSIILDSKEGDLLKFETISDERIDVAMAFPNIHYITNTGFVCYILNDLLKEGGKYTVKIMFENKLDNTLFLLETDTIIEN